MWRKHAGFRAMIVVGIVVVGACVVWALLAQTLVTPACDLANPPADVGPLSCPTDAPNTAGTPGS
jgi:hypothetical protein